MFKKRLKNHDLVSFGGKWYVKLGHAFYPITTDGIVKVDGLEEETISKIMRKGKVIYRKKDNKGEEMYYE